MQGRIATVQEVVEEVKKDIPFYENSNGGVTLSGGEPTMQPEFCIAILSECKKANLHTALDTSGFVKTEILTEILKYVDLVLYDIKHTDSEKHKKYTGVPNELILHNLRYINDMEIPIEIRIPTIPNINDSEENFSEVARIVNNLNSIERIRLLPYHRLGEGKYERLEMEYKLKGLESPNKVRMEELVKMLKSKLTRDIPVSAS